MWQFIRKNGYSRSEALKCAWANIKLRAAMKQRIVKFYFQKVDGSVREAFGTLKETLLPLRKERDARQTTPCKPTSTPRNRNTGVSRKRI